MVAHTSNLPTQGRDRGGSLKPVGTIGGRERGEEGKERGREGREGKKGGKGGRKGREGRDRRGNRNKERSILATCLYESPWSH